MSNSFTVGSMLGAAQIQSDDEAFWCRPVEEIVTDSSEEPPPDFCDGCKACKGCNFCAQPLNAMGE